jgi:hypothetical protein
MGSTEMSSTCPPVSLLVPAWRRDEDLFLRKSLAPAMCAQFMLLSSSAAEPSGALGLAASIAPVALLMGYLVRVTYRAHKEGQFYPWGHHG